MPILFPLVRRQSIRSVRQVGNPRLLRGIVPLPAASVSITGVSRDSAGAPLGGCTCTLFRVRESVSDGTGKGSYQYEQVAQTVSDGAGNYTFVVGFAGPYRVTFDLDGAPDLAGLTINTLSGV